VVTVSRSRLLAGALAVAVTVVAVAIVLMVRARPDNGSAADHAAVAPVPEGLATSCPPPGRDLAYPADGVLPDGAVAVRLCNGPLLHTDTGELLDTGFDAPDDALTTDVGALVELANGLPPAETEGRFCSDDAGPNFAYWFVYPGGDARAVLFNPGGCGDTTTAPGRLVEGGEALAATFRRGLLAQRLDQTPPGTDAVAGCNPNDAPLSPVATLDSVLLASLTYCVLTGPHGAGYREGHLTRAQLATVNRDTRVGGRPEGCASRRFSMLRGYTLWGDRVLISGICHSYRLGRDTWTASPAVVRMLEGLSMGPAEKQCVAFSGGRRDRTCPHW
jgi:hypothetical protein